MLLFFVLNKEVHKGWEGTFIFFENCPLKTALRSKGRTGAGSSIKKSRTAFFDVLGDGQRCQKSLFLPEFDPLLPKYDHFSGHFRGFLIECAGKILFFYCLGIALVLHYISFPSVFQLW